MVKLGIIVEGGTEKIILGSENFRELMNNLNISYIDEIINIEGSGNLLPHNLFPSIDVLQQKGANKFLILTDLHQDKCFSTVRNRINPPSTDYLITIAKKHIESWFLADTKFLQEFFKTHNISCENPEDEDDPFSYLSNLRKHHFGRGFGDKKLMAKIILNNGYSLTRASQHPRCNSLNYFMSKLSELKMQ